MIRKKTLLNMQSTIGYYIFGPSNFCHFPIVFFLSCGIFPSFNRCIYHILHIFSINNCIFIIVLSQNITNFCLFISTELLLRSSCEHCISKNQLHLYALFFSFMYLQLKIVLTARTQNTQYDSSAMSCFHKR